jgi:hypothetical protein
VLGACAALGCLTPEPADLVRAAIRARGGALPSWSRRSALDAHAVVPGHWQWILAFRLPDRLGLSLLVDGDEDQHFLFDGSAVRGFLGSAPLTVDRRQAATLRTFARFTAVASLDRLTDATHLSWSEIPREDLPPGVRRGLRARFHDDGEARYEVYFDGALRPIEARGPVVLPGAGEVSLSARFDDFRRVDGYRIAFGVHYALGAQALADEQVLRFVPNDPELDADYFRRVPGTRGSDAARRR